MCCARTKAPKVVNDALVAVRDCSGPFSARSERVSLLGVAGAEAWPRKGAGTKPGLEKGTTAVTHP